MKARGSEVVGEGARVDDDRGISLLVSAQVRWPGPWSSVDELGPLNESQGRDQK